MVEKVQQTECRTIIFKFREIDASKGFETGSTFSLILKDNAFDEYDGHQLIKLLDFMLMLYEKEHLKIFFLLKSESTCFQANIFFIRLGKFELNCIFCQISR